MTEKKTRNSCKERVNDRAEKERQQGVSVPTWWGRLGNENVGHQITQAL